MQLIQVKVDELKRLLKLPEHYNIIGGEYVLQKGAFQFVVSRSEKNPDGALIVVPIEILG